MRRAGWRTRLTYQAQRIKVRLVFAGFWLTDRVRSLVDRLSRDGGR